MTFWCHLFSTSWRRKQTKLSPTGTENGPKQKGHRKPGDHSESHRVI